MEEEIKGFLAKYDLDVRKSNDARFMDQKVTPDVLCIIADCVVNHLAGDSSKEFTVKDIWHSKYFISNVQAIFNKPTPIASLARSEYDKFIQQPLRMMSYAKVLNCRRKGSVNIYSVQSAELLEYIALRPRCSFDFLYVYLCKTLSDSGLLKYFQSYKQQFRKRRLSGHNFDELKDRFQRFILGNTRIRGKVEINRIFPKILNIYAAKNFIPGTIKGKMSKTPYNYSDLMYNRVNWRDKDKNKSVARQAAGSDSDGEMASKAYNNYLVQKAISIIKNKYRQSEVNDQWATGDATQVHHIFPKNQFPGIAHYVENLVKLTPTQHFTKAHPKNSTTKIDKDYQLVCLIAKSDSIEKSIEAGELIYRKECFIRVINEGVSRLTTFEFKNTMGYPEIKSGLVYYYNL